MGQRIKGCRMPRSKLYALSAPFLIRTARWRKFRSQRMDIPRVQAVYSS